ncbi:MAG: hypothetical protein WBA51_17930 [Erythrobacter sp.]
MIEIVPVMLFILGWHPDRQGEIDLQRPEVVFTSMEECEAAGAKMAARMTQAAADKSGAKYEHRCMTLPARQEFEAAYEQSENKKKGQ